MGAIIGACTGAGAEVWRDRAYYSMYIHTYRYTHITLRAEGHLWPRELWFLNIHTARCSRILVSVR